MGLMSKGEEKRLADIYLRVKCPNNPEKKQVIAIGKKTGCAVELHPVEIIYNTPSILLFYCGAFHSTPRFFLSN